MSYLEESLSEGEEIQAVFHFHWLIYARMGFWVALAMLCAWGLHSAWGTALLVCIAAGEYIRINSVEQAVTNKRVILKAGYVARKTEEMKLGSIETIEIQQSIMQRMLGQGTVKVTGRGLSDVIFKSIYSPLSVKRAIESVRPHTDD